MLKFYDISAIKIKNNLFMFCFCTNIGHTPFMNIHRYMRKAEEIESFEFKGSQLSRHHSDLIRL